MASSALPNINGYQLIENWSTSGSCRWSYARKNGREWFIKQFMAPKYKKVEDGISPKKVESSRVRCEAFRDSQSKLYAQVQDAARVSGNIVAADSFFSFDTMFYSVTERIDISSASIEDVSRLDVKQKLILLKVLTHSLRNLHERGVVHADLKPDNVLIKRTATGHTLKLIDFDSSYLESLPKRGEKVCFDVSFVAPETIDAYNDESIDLTHKVDIFALGLLFHLYFTGAMPQVSEDYSNACSAVRDGVEPTLSPSLPEWLRKLIRAMLLLKPEDRPDTGTVFQSLVQERFPIAPSFEDVLALAPARKQALLIRLTQNLLELHRGGNAPIGIAPRNLRTNEHSDGCTLELLLHPASTGAFSGDDHFLFAPEALSGHTLPTGQADVFSLGILFHLILSGKIPVYPRQYQGLGDAVRRGTVLRPDSSITGWMGALVSDMLQRDPRHRPMPEQVLKALKDENWPVIPVPPGTPPVPSPEKPAALEPKKKKGFENLTRFH